jgi:hypothetical protein
VLKGEYIRGDGLVIPNTVTRAGAAFVLAAAFKGVWNGVYMALVAGAPIPDLQMGQLVEPTIGVNGYARQELEQTLDWDTEGTLNGVPYIESAAKVFAATNSGFNQAIRRLALVPTLTDLTGDVYSVSAPLPADLSILSTTPVENRTFRYRVYLT